MRLFNFKSFLDQKIDLAPLTLLSGLNGVGKSTALQAMALLRQSMNAGVLNGDGWLLNGDLVELGTGDDVLHENFNEPVIGIDLIEWGKTFSWRVRYVLGADVLPYSSSGLEAKPVAIPEALFGSAFQYLRADRVNPATSYSKSFDTAGRRGFMGPRGEYSAHFLSLFRNSIVPEKLRYQQNDLLTPGLLTQVNAWMQEFSPGVAIDVHDIERTDFVRLSYQYGGSAGINASNNSYRPTNVGFGLTYSLPIVIACLSTPPGGLILLENPEAHLHPKGQAAMGRLMALAAASGVQILVETHSDHVLNGIRLAVKQRDIEPEATCVHFFSRDKANGCAIIDSPRINAEGRLSHWPNDFFDQWDKSLDALLD
jgi:predicted ATPase